METVDASSHYTQGAAEEKPSLLVLILDTNPYAWQELHSRLPIQTALAHILLFLNAHLSFSHANQVAVIASHTKEATFLYPTASPVPAREPPADPYRDANKYRLFAQIEDEVQASLQQLLAHTSIDALSGTNETMMAGALSLALTYIHRVCNADNIDVGTTLPRPGDIPRQDVASMTARILVVSVSGDLANQYVSVMNSIFAAQRQRVPIDICKIAGDTVFLQQASDSTGGIYMQLEHPNSLLQYLLSCFISDPATRRHLIPPSQVNVDFRAACFCHKRVVDIGFVCSICLSSQLTLASVRSLSSPPEELWNARESTWRKDWEIRRGDEMYCFASNYNISDDSNLSLPTETSWENTVQDDLTPEGEAIVQWWQDYGDHYMKLEFEKAQRRKDRLEQFAPSHNERRYRKTWGVV